MVMNWSKPRLAFLVFSALMAGAGSGDSAAEVDQSATRPAEAAASPEAEPAPQARHLLDLIPGHYGTVIQVRPSVFIL
jgi:hypothetical protein